MSDPIHNAIADMLRTIPEQWTDFDHDSLSSLSQRALLLLVAGGLVERKMTVRSRCAGSPVPFVWSAAMTGENGAFEALMPALSMMWGEWKSLFPSEVTHPFTCELLPPQQWRLTEHGVVAREDLSAPNPAVYDWALRRGIFAGECVRGAGRLISCNQVETATTQTVNIGNWEDGAKMFEAFFKAMQKTEKPSGTVEDRMMSKFRQDTRCIDWTAEEWAAELGCSKTAVIQTNTWAAIMKERAKREQERKTRSK